MLGRIYSIELVDTKKTETISSDNAIDNNFETPTTTSSQEPISSNNTTTSNIESTQTESSLPQSTSNVESSITSSSTDDDFIPIFWNQKIHKYDNHYDNISGINIPYLVVEPHNYDQSKKYPVILFFLQFHDSFYVRRLREHIQRLNQFNIILGCQNSQIL